MSALSFLPLLCLAAPGDAVLVEFASQTCPHCKAMEPILTRLSKEGCPVQIIDVDRQPDVAQQFKIKGVPTFVALAAGRETGRIEGATTYEKLLALYVAAGGKPQQVAGFGASVQPASYQPTDYQQPSAPPASFQSPPQAMAAGGASPQQAALAATVKLRVEDAGGYGFGTGTIIDTHEGEALVVTCGHLFRESQGKGRITADVFTAAGPQNVEGQMIAYDLDRDIALVSLKAAGVTPAAVAPPGHAVRPGDAAFTLGCDKGADPTVRQTHITAVNKYQGRPNYTAAGQPVDGRSGGGLFSADGKLIGICNAADPADDEGLYAGLASIHWQLDQINMSEIYQRSAQVAQAVQPASADTNVRPTAPPQMPAAMPAGLPPAAGDLIPIAANDDSEIVFIVRSKRDPSQRSEVFVVDQAPPDLLARIVQAARASGEQRAELARAAANTRPQQPYQPLGSPAVIRGQSAE